MKIEILAAFGELCMTIEDGERLHGMVHDPLRDGEEVELDFAGVRIVAPPFLNPGIGALYADLAAETIATRLRLSNLSELGERVARRVMENSRKYFEGSEAYRAAVDRVVGMHPDDLLAGEEGGGDWNGEGEDEAGAPE